MDVKIKKLREDATLPNYETDGSAGFDLPAATFPYTQIIPPNEYKLVKTGLAMEIPEGYELQIRSRSGLAAKAGVQAHVGTIDSDYRGEIGVILFNFGNDALRIDHGDRIAQGVINEITRANFVEVEELGETERGSGGYGSTGIKGGSENG